MCLSVGLSVLSGLSCPVTRRVSGCWLSVTVDLKRLYFATGVKNRPTVFLFMDTQIVEEAFVEDINNILSSGEVSNLYKSDEFEEVS